VNRNFEQSMNATTPAADTATEGDPRNLSDLASTSSSRFPPDPPCSSGEGSGIAAASMGSIAPCSETSRRCDHLTLSEKLTPLLISAGLVRGTTLTFGQRLSNRQIPAGVSFAPDGSVAAIQKGGFLFLNESQVKDATDGNKHG